MPYTRRDDSRAGTRENPDCLLRSVGQDRESWNDKGVSAPFLLPASKPRYCAVVVDDSRDAAESFVRLLIAIGCEATSVTDARDALAEVLHKRPHIVFLDIGMPQIDGYQLASMVRRFFNSDEVKLVAVTGYGAAEDRARARKAGFDAHVLKPVDPAIVESILKTVIEGR
jgi:CheY-like chemotaxis protein